MATSAEPADNKKAGYFPRHDTPLIPELITSERPENLDGYFEFVEGLLDKSFRDAALVHVALKTTKITSLEFNPNDKDDTGDAAASKPSRSTGGGGSSSSSGAGSSSSSSSSEKKKDKKKKPQPFVVPNHFIFSPRLIVNRDGTTFGKFKVGTKVTVDGIVDCYQRVKIDTNGAVTMKVTAGDLMKSGVSLDGLVQVNLLDDAIRDEVSLRASVDREAVCFSMLGSRDGAGTTALKADGDVRLFNVHVGCGVEHHWGGYGPNTTAPMNNNATNVVSGFGPAHIGGGESGLVDPNEEDPSRMGSFGHGSHTGALSHNSLGGGNGPVPLPPSSTLYVGAGCFGKGWHMAGKLFRDDGDWTEAQIVLYQNIHKLASIAAVYKVNTQDGIAETTIGVSRRFTLWGHKLVMAAKFSTSGLLSVLTEVNLDMFTRIGVVTRFTPGSGERPTFGILASLQSD